MCTFECNSDLFIYVNGDPYDIGNVDERGNHIRIWSIPAVISICILSLARCVTKLLSLDEFAFLLSTFKMHYNPAGLILRSMLVETGGRAFLNDV